MSDASTPTPAPRKPVASIAALVAAACAAVTPLAKSSEGERTRAYVDPVGRLTVCYGHTGQDVAAGETRTPAQCDELLRQDLLKVGMAIAPCIRVPISTEARSAFMSFALNVGQGNFCRSTIAKRLNAGDLKAACAGLSDWVYAAHPPAKLPGLVIRRGKERALCERGLP